MRGLFVSAAFAAALIGMGLTHDALASGADKVHLCHMNGTGSTPATAVMDYSEEYTYGEDHYEYSYHYTYTYTFGRMIEVGADAADSHYAHGDSNQFGALTEYMATYLTTWDENDTSYTETYDYRPDYDYYGSVSYTYDYTNGVIGNANCYAYSYTEN